MKPLLLILAGTTALALGAAVILQVSHSRSRARLLDELADTRATLSSTEEEKTEAVGRGELLAGRVAALESEVANTTSRLEAAEVRSAGLARDLDGLRQIAAAHEADVRRLKDENAALTAELVQSRLSPATLDAAELQQARETVASLEAKVAQLEAAAREATAPPAPPDQVRVLGVGPENAFVVLDFGARKGAAVNQLLLVRRGSAPLATVAIRTVHARHAIAHVIPDSLQGSLRDGDVAILLN